MGHRPVTRVKERVCVYHLVEVTAPVPGPFLLQRIVSHPQTYTGFVDTGYLHAEGAKATGNNRGAMRPIAANIVAWFRSLAGNKLAGQSLERVYWYDGAFPTSDHRHSGQLRALNAIAQTPDLEIRLGYLVERHSPLEHPIMAALASTEAGLGLTPGSLLAEFRKHWQFHPRIEQKGVDTLLALDLVNFANRSANGTAVLIAGDLDLLEPVRQARSLGVRVLVATPNQNTVARELRQLADDVFNITPADLQRMLQPRPSNSR